MSPKLEFWSTLAHLMALEDFISYIECFFNRRNVASRADDIVAA